MLGVTVDVPTSPPEFLTKSKSGFIVFVDGETICTPSEFLKINSKSICILYLNKLGRSILKGHTYLLNNGS